MLRLNPNIRPPEGYTFTDADGFKHVSTSMDRLLKSIADYRVRIGKPPGNPDAEVHEQICKRSPKICMNDSTPFDAKILVARVIKTLGWAYGEIRRGRCSPMDLAEAKRRAAICAGCPLNVDWASHCPPCKKSAQRVLDIIFKPGSVFKPLSGRACLNAGDDLSVAVFMPEGDAVTNPPGPCWREDTT